MSHERLSDDRLARAAAQGKPDAFDEIYARYNSALYGYCLSILHDAEEARDALQATMEKAYRAIGSQRVRGGLKAWLFGIAHNEAISLTRARPATQSYGSEPAFVPAAADPADRDRLAQLVADLKTLPEQQRSALVLRELSGLRSDEIGAALGITPAAAKQSVYEARAALLAQSGGRDMDCRQVQMKLSEADGRVRRGRRVKAHLADCALCTAFAASIPGRSADLRAVFPPLAAAAAAQTLAAVTSTGAGGVAAGAARKSWAAAVGVGLAVVAAGTLGVVAVNQSDSEPSRPAAPAQAAPARQAPAPKPAATPKTAPSSPAPARRSADRPPAAATGYSDLGPGVLGGLESTDGGAGGAAGPSAPAAGAAADDGGASLPFSGLELALVALAGAVLLGTGVAMRRLTGAPPH